MQPFICDPIGVIRSCFTEKFGIPRQAGLVPEASASLDLFPPYDAPDTLREIDGFSHIWVVFLFHACLGAGWRATVRPPRLGGNKRVGLWASRSPFRPNPVGISAVRLKAILREEGRTRLLLAGGDFLDGTPVIDIKPYVRYADSIADARCGYADAPPEPRPVHFSKAAEMRCAAWTENGRPEIRQVIAQVLRWDPRPAYRDSESGRVHGFRLWDLNVRFQMRNEAVWVMDIEKAPSGERDHEP